MTESVPNDFNDEVGLLYQTKESRCIRLQKKLKKNFLVVLMVIVVIVIVIIGLAVGLSGRGGSIGSPVLYPTTSGRFRNLKGFSFSGDSRNVVVRQFDEFAISGGKFVDPNSPNLPVEDLGGAVVLPGLIDAHCHLFSLGEGMLWPNINNMNISSIVSTIEQWISTRPSAPAPGDWVFGGRWDFQPDNFPTASDLGKYICLLSLFY